MVLIALALVQDLDIGEADPDEDDDQSIDDLIRVGGRRNATWRKLLMAEWAPEKLNQQYFGLLYGLPPFVVDKNSWRASPNPQEAFTLTNSCCEPESKGSFLEGEPNLIIYYQGYRFDSIPHIDLITSAPCESTAVTVSRMAMDQLFFDIQFNRIPRLFSPKPLLASHLAIWAMPEKTNNTCQKKRVTATREQWLHYLEHVAEERICASCWATQFKIFLDEWGFVQNTDCWPTGTNGSSLHFKWVWPQ